jgi:hypothetical protein
MVLPISGHLDDSRIARRSARNHCDLPHAGFSTMTVGHPGIGDLGSREALFSSTESTSKQPVARHTSRIDSVAHLTSRRRRCLACLQWRRPGSLVRGRAATVIQAKTETSPQPVRDVDRVQSAPVAVRYRLAIRGGDHTCIHGTQHCHWLNRLNKLPPPGGYVQLR